MQVPPGRRERCRAGSPLGPRLRWRRGGGPPLAETWACLAGRDSGLVERARSSEGGGALDSPERASPRPSAGGQAHPFFVRHVAEEAGEASLEVEDVSDSVESRGGCAGPSWLSLRSEPCSLRRSGERGHGSHGGEPRSCCRGGLAYLAEGPPRTARALRKDGPGRRKERGREQLEIGRLPRGAAPPHEPGPGPVRSWLYSAVSPPSSPSRRRKPRALAPVSGLGAQRTRPRRSAVTSRSRSRLPGSPLRLSSREP